MVGDLQKASMWKRISAFLFDGILLSVLVVAFAWLLSLAFGYDSYNQTLDAAYASYEKQYGVVFEITEETYNAMTEQERQNYDAAYDALIADKAVLYAYNMVLNLTLMITTISILLSFLVLEFVVPLCFGNGQTLGKKVFSIGLIRTDGVRVNNMQLFVRTVLGKFTIETMIPVYVLIMLLFGSIGLTGTVILGAVLTGQLVCLAVTHTNSAIHDLLAGTVAVDISSQMIFRDTQSLIEYKKKLHAEQVKKQEY